MQRKSQGSAEPLSTHSSIQILANEHSLPDVRAYWSVGSDAGELSGVLFLTVEAEHRTADFDHTATFIMPILGLCRCCCRIPCGVGGSGWPGRHNPLS